MACQADDRPARPRPPPRNGAATAGTCVPSLLVVPQPPTRSTDLSPNVRKRPGISTCAHRSEPPSASSVPPPGEKAIMNRTDRVLHIPDRSCATYTVCRPALNKPGQNGIISAAFRARKSDKPAWSGLQTGGDDQRRRTGVAGAAGAAPPGTPRPRCGHIGAPGGAGVRSIAGPAAQEAQALPEGPHLFY